jgi:hypothetical protein
MTRPVQWPIRLALAVFLGFALGVRAYTVAAHTSTDFTQIWFAAHALLAGANPYRVIGPGLTYASPWPFFYPLPAGLVAIPLAPLSVSVATALFVALSAACFAWALMAHGVAPLLGMMSAAMIVAAELGQWSPILAAAVVLAPLGVLGVAKPTLGLAVLVARPSWWTVSGAVVLSGLAFAISPHWVVDWREAFVRFGAHRPLHFRAPVVHPGGVLSLLALLRWRRPEARLLATLACVPQTMILYEALPLFLIPRTAFECVALLLLSYAAQAAMLLAGDDLIVGGRWLVWCLYLPCLVMVLRRPNEGVAREWLERRIASFPPWLRGRAFPDAAS